MPPADNDDGKLPMPPELATVAKPARATLVDIILFGLTRLMLIETTLAEARERRYETNDAPPQHPVDPDRAEFLFKTEREDSNHTDDKVKQLLTLSSSLCTVILVFARDVRPKWMVVTLLALLVSTVVLCLSILDVRTIHVPDAPDSTQSNEKDPWAADLMTSLILNRQRLSFRVDRYRAATRFFRLALLLTPFAAFFTVARPDPTEKIVRSVDSLNSSVRGVAAEIKSIPRIRSVDTIVVTPPKSSTPAGVTKARRDTGR